MKNFVAGLIVAACCVGCNSDHSNATLEYFNLSTNEIWVTDIIGLPPNATPGRLVPSPEESQLFVAGIHFLGPLRVKERITILWVDNGAQGWPGGRPDPGSVPPGVTHQLELKREELGIASEVGGTIRFTYLGNDKWSVTQLKK